MNPLPVRLHASSVSEIFADLRFQAFWDSFFYHTFCMKEISGLSVKINTLGTAQLTKDRNKLQGKWQHKFQTWFPKGINEPNLALLKVKVNKVDYWESSSSSSPQTINFLELSHR